MYIGFKEEIKLQYYQIQDFSTEHERREERDLCAKNEKEEIQNRGEEGQGPAEACVIVLPQSFDPGCCSCCYLEHLYLIRGKWVVREKEKTLPSP